MRWISPSAFRTFFVLDNGRVAVELMIGIDGIAEIMDVDAGSKEFQERLTGKRYITLDAAKEAIEQEWTVDGDYEAPPDEDR